MIARATAAMAPISTILRGPIINYVASCLRELIKTFLEADVIFSSQHICTFHVEGRFTQNRISLNLRLSKGVDNRYVFF